MSYPNDLTRSKNWTKEILKSVDLKAGFDEIINWVMAALDITNGHDHSGAANKGKPISPANGMVIASQSQGDVLYAASGISWARLGAGTKGKCLTTGGAGANPTYEGMTTQGDIEYHDGTTRARLGKGTGLQKLRMNAGATAPEWADETPGLGSWVDKSSGYGAQQAATDGFVVAYAALGGSGTLNGYTDSNANPITQRQGSNIDASSGGTFSITMPVKKGDYWKVTVSGQISISVYWIPLGA